MGSRSAPDAVAELAHITESVVDHLRLGTASWYWGRDCWWRGLPGNAIPPFVATRSVGMIAVALVIAHVAIAGSPIRVVVLFQTKGECIAAPLSVLNNRGMSRVVYIRDSRIKVTARDLLVRPPRLIAVKRLAGKNAAGVVLIDQ